MRALDELFPDGHTASSRSSHWSVTASRRPAAVEMLATIYAFQTGFVPAPPQVAPGHPRLVNGRTPRMPGLMMKSSLGLGGYNTAMVIAEPGESPWDSRIAEFGTPDQALTRLKVGPEQPIPEAYGHYEQLRRRGAQGVVRSDRARRVPPSANAPSSCPRRSVSPTTNSSR